MNIVFEEYQDLLAEMIRLPSFSRREEKTAQLIFNFLAHKNIMALRHFNNVYVRNRHFDKNKPTIILNSHHDTVQPNKDWKRDPFDPQVKYNKLFGLGSNDAGASLVCLLAVFLHYYEREELNYNLVYIASAEEEVSGKDGVITVLPLIENIKFGIIGEPTSLRMAVAEKGLMVIDCTAYGKSGHAARDEGENAIYNALEDILRIRKLSFPEKSKYLGDVKITVTMIQSGSQHNVVPDECTFTLDVRSTDVYRNEEILRSLESRLNSRIKARSTRLQPSSISLEHPVVKSAEKLGIELFGSVTLSDQALMDFPTVKIGPGDSSRSHTADEYILLDEMREGIKTYINLLNELLSE